MTNTWLLLTYKVPPEPAAKRVSLWRKLKGMGAVYLQSGVCLLPKTDDHLRRMKVVENEIAAIGGEGVLLETVALDRVQEEKVVARFTADRDEAYREFIDKCDDFDAEIAKETAAEHFTYAELEENDVDLAKLKGWLDKVHGRDAFGAAGIGGARAALERCEQALEDYAARVYAVEGEEPPPAK